MKQLDLGLQGSQTPIHRERDCPKNVSFGAWSSFLDDVCLRGGVQFTHEGIIGFLHRISPEFQMVKSLDELNAVHLVRMESEVTDSRWKLGG